jgi:hypothetical protein
MTSRPLDVLVSGRIAATPGQGGAAWAVLQYVVGLHRLGHRVDLVELVRPDEIVPSGATLVGSINMTYLASAMESVGLGDRWAIGLAGGDLAGGDLAGGDLAGPAADHMSSGRWDLLVNLSGCLDAPELMERCEIRCFVDLDPGFTQAWEAQGVGGLGLDGHTHHATLGTSIGDPGCPVPTGDRSWIPFVPPVVLESWPAGAPVQLPAFTTVANWRSYGSAEWDGVSYGQRAHSFRGLVGLASVSPVALWPALAIDPAETEDLRLLHDRGWHVLNPALLAATPDAYRKFVAGSMGELSVAKSGYVAGRSGWFSDRSACYLASGRPVVAQDTGFSDRLPVGAGLLAYDDVDSAVEALTSVTSDYAGHAAAARRLAEEHFDSGRVLGGLLEAVGCDAG